MLKISIASIGVIIRISIVLFCVLSVIAFFLFPDEYDVMTFTSGSYTVYGYHIGFPLPIVMFWPSGMLHELSPLAVIICIVADVLFAFFVVFMLVYGYGFILEVVRPLHKWYLFRDMK